MNSKNNEILRAAEAATKSKNIQINRKVDNTSRNLNPPRKKLDIPKSDVYTDTMYKTNDHEHDLPDESKTFKYVYDSAAETDFKKSGMLRRTPMGIIIFDSYNNPWFPMTSVTVDKNNFSLRLLRSEFHQKFGGSSFTDLYMPWHFTVELIDRNYYVISSRPLGYKSLIPEYEDYISVCIAGDSNIDVYPAELYKMISNMIINPMHYMPGWRINPYNNISTINIGKNFRYSQLSKNFK